MQIFFVPVRIRISRWPTAIQSSRVQSIPVRHEDHFPYSYYTSSRTPSHVHRGGGDAHAQTSLQRGGKKEEERAAVAASGREREGEWEGAAWRRQRGEGKELQLEYHASITPKARIGGFSEV